MQPFEELFTLPIIKFKKLTNHINLHIMKNKLILYYITLFLSIFLSLESNAKIHRIFVWDGYSQFLRSEMDEKIYLGDTIQWYSNKSAKRSHTITSTKIPVGAKTFNFPVPIANQEFNYIIEKPGIYEYECTPHAPFMSGFFEVESPSGIGDKIEYRTFETGPIIHPNPVTDKMRIAQLSPEILYQLTISDAMGKSIYSTTLKNSAFADVDISQYPLGTYTAQLSYCTCKPQKNGCGGAGKTLKFIKQ